MLKRCFAFLILSACLLIAIPPAAYADVLIEPENDFFLRHRDECKSLERSFYANGEGGSVSIKEEPGSKKEVTVIENGETLYIISTYNHKGEVWGVTEMYKSNGSNDELLTGWIPMNQLLLVYDYISFAEEHKSELHEYSGSYETLETADKIVIWAWPGSGIILETIDNSDMDSNNFNISDAYTDEQSREWGFIGYWYGQRNVWICVSDPANAEIPEFNPAPPPEFWQPGDTTSQSGLSVPILVVILVVFAAAATAVLIRVFWKPKKG